MKKIFLITKYFSILSVVLVAELGFAQTAENKKAETFLSFLSSQVVGRPLNASEISLLNSSGTAAYPQIINAWSLEPMFAENMRMYVENLLKTSGESPTIDFNRPGYLARDIAKKKRPYSELLTANYCIDKAGATTTCDTQAPFTAGVLTTKAFLVTYKGAYNIRRAGKITKKFLCTSFPLSPTEEPRLTEAELIAQFSTQNGAISFGNGNNCYSCHSQFGLHAQFFVKFDSQGLYQPTATGLQNPSTSVSDGFSTNGTYTSHLKDPARAQSEVSRILGQNANNLADAAAIVTKNSRFIPCGVQNMMQYFLRMGDENAKTVNAELYSQIAQNAKTLNPQPSFVDILQAIVTNQTVYNSFFKSGVQP